MRALTKFRIAAITFTIASLLLAGVAVAQKRIEISAEEKAWHLVATMVLDTCTDSVQGITDLALAGTTEYLQWEPFVDMLAQCGVMLQALPDPPSKYNHTVADLRQAGREYSLASRNYRAGIQHLDRVRLSKAADNLDNGWFYLDRADRTYPEQ